MPPIVPYVAGAAQTSSGQMSGAFWEIACFPVFKSSCLKYHRYIKDKDRHSDDFECYSGCCCCCYPCIGLPFDIIWTTLRPLVIGFAAIGMACGTCLQSDECHSCCVSCCKGCGALLWGVSCGACVACVQVIARISRAVS
jgi:hypothetical protein